MAERWAEPIAKELEDVEEFLQGLLRSGNAELDEMCRYVLESGGKRVRPIICILSYLACGGTDPARAVSVGSAFEVVHSASLIHDDINDNGEMRRGRRALHKEYTLTKAVVAGDFMLVKGYRALGLMSHEIMDIISDTASRMCASEFLQKDFERKAEVTEEDYYEIIDGKTAMLIRASALSGAYLATQDMELIEAVGRYAEAVGMAFQIVDDVLDVTGCTGVTGKKVGIDIMEGKPTLPVIYAMHDPEVGKEVEAIFTGEGISQEDVSRALDLIKGTDALDRCMDEARARADEAIDALSALPPSEYRDSLEGLARYVVSRRG